MKSVFCPLRISSVKIFINVKKKTLGEGDGKPLRVPALHVIKKGRRSDVIRGAFPLLLEKASEGTVGGRW